MDVHKLNNLTGLPVCWGNVNRGWAIKHTDVIDNVTCVDCLRLLARDAVIYGNARRAKKR